MANNQKELEKKEAVTYELGYLLSPFFPAEKVEESVEAMYKTWIEDLGGVIVLKTAPKMRALAYPVAKVINNKKSLYNEAYFAAVKFQISPESIGTIKEMVEKDSNIVRFLIINVPKRAEKVVIPRTTFERKPQAVVEETKAEKVEEMSNEDIDKEIDDLLDTPSA